MIYYTQERQIPNNTPTKKGSQHHENYLRTETHQRQKVLLWQSRGNRERQR